MEFPDVNALMNYDSKMIGFKSNCAFIILQILEHSH